MMGDIGRAIDAMLSLLICLVFIAVPLAIWKVIDIIVWLYYNVNITIGN